MTSLAMPDLSCYHQALDGLTTRRLSGRVVQVVGLTIEAMGLDCEIGEVCEIRANDSNSLLSEVVGFRSQRTLLMPLGTFTDTVFGNSVAGQKISPPNRLGATFGARTVRITELKSSPLTYPNSSRANASNWEVFIDRSVAVIVKAVAYFRDRLARNAPPQAIAL